MSLASEIEFSLKLLSLLDATHESTVYSPASILNALAMIYVGADGETAKQIEEIIGGKNVDKNGIIKYYAEFVKAASEKQAKTTQSNSRKRKAVDKSDIKISMANRLFVFDEHKFIPAYDKLIQDSFNGGSQQLDNSKNVEAAKIINKFVETSTNGVIQEAIEAANIDEITSLIIVNAIHFLGYWKEIFGRCENENLLEVIRNGILEVVMIGKLWEYHINLEKLGFLLFYQMQKRVCQSYLRNLIMKYSKMLLQIRCDLSGMLSGKHCIGKAIHKAVIKVDEEGTEASAVTVGIPVACSGNNGYFIADHPFLYFITTSNKPGNIEPKNILFIGTFC